MNAITGSQLHAVVRRQAERRLRWDRVDRIHAGVGVNKDGLVIVGIKCVMFDGRRNVRRRAGDPRRAKGRCGVGIPVGYIQGKGCGRSAWVDVITEKVSH